MPYDSQGRWIEENEWQQMMREQAARRVGAFSRYDTPAPSVYPYQAAPYESFGVTPSVGPYQTSPFMRRREEPATAPFDTSEPAPMYGPGSDPRLGWKFNNDPIALNEALSKPSFTDPLNVLNQQATGTITPTEDVNLAGMPFAGAVTGANELINKAPFVSANPLSVLAKTEMLPSIFNYDAGPVVQNVFDTIMPTADAAQASIVPQTSSLTPFASQPSMGRASLPGRTPQAAGDDRGDPGAYFGGEQGGHGGFESSDYPGLFPWGPGTDPVTDDQTSNTGFRPGFGTQRDYYAQQPEDDAGDDFFGDGDVSGDYSLSSADINAMMSRASQGSDESTVDRYGLSGWTPELPSIPENTFDALEPLRDYLKDITKGTTLPAPLPQMSTDDFINIAMTPHLPKGILDKSIDKDRLEKAIIAKAKTAPKGNLERIAAARAEQQAAAAAQRAATRQANMRAAQRKAMLAKQKLAAKNKLAAQKAAAAQARAAVQAQARAQAQAQSEANAAIERVAKATALMNSKAYNESGLDGLSAAERDIVAAAQVDTFAGIGGMGMGFMGSNVGQEDGGGYTGGDFSSGQGWE